jgi:hypothetical protein
VVEIGQRVQVWFERNPDAYYVPDFVMDGRFGEHTGPRATAEHLAEAGSDPNRVAAVLLGASLFTRIESTRKHYPRDEWPPISIAETLREWMRRTHDSRWHASCTSTLPLHYGGCGCVIRSMQGFLEALALEHARALHAFVPVRVEFVGGDPVSPVRLVN